MSALPERAHRAGVRYVLLSGLRGLAWGFLAAFFGGIAVATFARDPDAGISVGVLARICPLRVHAARAVRSGGHCPYCRSGAAGRAPGFSCRACHQRVIVRDKRFLTVEEAARKGCSGIMLGVWRKEGVAPVPASVERTIIAQWLKAETLRDADPRYHRSQAVEAYQLLLSLLASNPVPPRISLEKVREDLQRLEWEQVSEREAGEGIRMRAGVG